MGLSDMCLNISWHWKRDLSQFSESVQATCLLLTLVYPQMFLQPYWESTLSILKSGTTACLASLFPAREKQKEYLKSFPLRDIKNDITSSAQGGDAPPAPSRHSLTHFTCAVDVSEDQHSGNTVATAVENRAWNRGCTSVCLIMISSELY